MERSELAIVIPAFNEAVTIEQVVKSVLPYGIPIVVDDCSTDNTGLLASNAGAIVVKHKNNKGYDAALNTGFKEAEKTKFNFVITFDADGQHDSSLLKIYIEKLMDGYELVLGRRDKLARISEYLFSMYTRIFFNINDPLCGMKGYDIKLYKKHGCFDSYKSVGTELALFGLKETVKYIEIDIPIIKRRDKPRFAGVIKANCIILRSMLLSLMRV